MSDLSVCTSKSPTFKIFLNSCLLSVEASFVQFLQLTQMMWVNFRNSILVMSSVINLVQSYSVVSCTAVNTSTYTYVSVSAGSTVNVYVNVPAGKTYELLKINFGSQSTDSLTFKDLVYNNGQVSGTGPRCDAILPDNYWLPSGTTYIYSITCNNYFYSCNVWYLITGILYTASTPAPTTSGSVGNPVASPSPSPSSGASSASTYVNTFTRSSYSCSGYTLSDCQMKCSSSYDVWIQGANTQCYPSYSGNDCSCTELDFNSGSNAYGTITYSADSAVIILSNGSGSCSFQYSASQALCSYCSQLQTIILLILTLPGVGIGLIAPGLDICIQGRRGRSDRTMLLIYLGNFFWILLGGWLFFFMYLINAILLASFLVLIPFSFKILQFSVYALLPFGREMQKHDLNTKDEKESCVIATAVYIIVGGILICIQHLLMAIGLMLTIVFIPIGLKHLELAQHALIPFGKTVRITGDEINICGGNRGNRSQASDGIQATQIKTTNA
jgi:uncharacterized membrane protein YccF (DUF307 family)